jgi:two-component system, chemotaxis family, protein-glutamate methylesterase/glutaminase
VLGPKFPAPILLVQHMSPAFHAGFVAWLDGVTPLPVSIAKEGESPLPGRVYVAPANEHLKLVAGRLRLDASEPIGGHRPSGTVLFRSLAREGSCAAVGALLTGMGDDGAEGLLELRRSGGYTLAEDETTAVVYGMPAEAVRIGAACETLPLPAVAARIAELLPPRAK